jgi:hypothetical protein
LYRLSHKINISSKTSKELLMSANLRVFLLIYQKEDK